MKAIKIFLIPALFLTFVAQSNGQMWFDMGLKFAVGPTIMYNKNIFDDRQYDHTLTSGTAIGGKFGVNFADYHAFTIDFMSATSKQDFEFQVASVSGTNAFEWKHNDFLLLYRFSGSGAFVELGPKLSNVSSVSQSVNGVAEVDASANFEDSYMSAVFGFGSYLLGGDLATLQIGVRLHYALDDFISADGQVLNYPNEIAYAEYRETKATAVQFGVEFNYAFGRFAKASCSDRWKLILFQ